MKKVAILLGSDSDLKYVEASKEYFEHFGINCEVHILSAHRTPGKVAKFASGAPEIAEIGLPLSFRLGPV